MKQNLFIVLLGFIVCFSTYSCKKEQVGPSGFQGSGSSNSDNIDPKQPIYLTANNWKMEQQGIYVHTFKNIMNANDVNKVRVYLSTNGVDTLINQFIDYNGGILWAIFNTTDVKINFRSSGGIPFSSLSIKVAFE